MPFGHRDARSPFGSQITVQQSSDRKRRFLLISFAVLAADQWSKWWIEHNVAPYDRIEVIPDLFNLIFAKNTGIAFGLFPARGELLGTAILALLGLAALTLVSLLFVRTPSDQTTLLLALALVLGGAVGNLTDRLMLGAVTDFLDVYRGSRHFPTFNIADSAISVGIFFLAWDSLFGGAAAASELDRGSEAGA